MAEEEKTETTEPAPAENTAGPAAGQNPPGDPEPLAEQTPPPESADQSADAPETAPTVPPEDPQTTPLPDFSNMIARAAAHSIDMLNDVELNVKIELGRAEMTIEQILHLTQGSVVELDKLAGDPVDVLVNEQLVARGEVLVVNDNFCVRINEIVTSISERMAQSVPDQVPAE